jgi:hypothetical protein
VAEPHEGDEPEELGGRTLQQNPAALPARGELEPRERVHRDGVGCDARHVAAHDVGAARRQECADAFAQTRQVGADNRAADGEGDLVRPGCRHVQVGPASAPELIVALA